MAPREEGAVLAKVYTCAVAGLDGELAESRPRLGGSLAWFLTSYLSSPLPTTE